MEQYWLPTQQQIDTEVATNTASWQQQLTLRLNSYGFFWANLYPIYLFKLLAIMMLGMACYKLGIFQGMRSKGFYAWHGVIATAIGIVLSVYSQLQLEQSNYQMEVGQQLLVSINYWASLITAWGYICLILWCV